MKNNTQDLGRYILNRKLLLIFIVGLFFLINSCCDEPAEEYSKVNDIKLTLYSDKSTHNQLFDYDSTDTDTLTIQVQFDYDFIVYKRPKFSLIQTAYATSCPKPGKNGLKSKIMSMTVTSNQSFMDREPNTSLNDLITCRYNYYESNISLDSMKDSLNNWNYYFLEYPFNIFINHSSDNSFNHQFKLNIQFEDGQKITKETVWIKWK